MTMHLPVLIRSRLICGFLFSLFFFLSGCTAGDQTAVSSSCRMPDWPWQDGDLPLDPALQTGQLANGLRYVIMKNHEPRDRVAMQLLVMAGSLQENEKQRGLAHFLEHMMFNGTVHYSPGTLVEYFQSIGMEFGADTNAHTGFDQTVYKLLLPSASLEHLGRGLEVMADYARRALLGEDEVEQERGVILAEKLARDTAEYRVRRNRMETAFAGSLIARRDIIGEEKTLKGADSALLRSYYDAWYRPDNMVLVLVGDLEPGSARELIDDHFSALQPAVSGPPPCPDYGAVDEEARRGFFIHEPSLGRTELSIESVWNQVPPEDSLDWEKEQLERYVAASIMNNRLEQLVRRSGSPLTEARVYGGSFLRLLGYVSLSAHTDAKRWQEGLELLGGSLRQALLDGFSDKELERAKREILAYLEKQAQTAQSRDSSQLAGMIVGKLSDREVILSPVQEQQLFAPLVEAMNLATVNQAFRSLWRHPGRVVGVAGDADLGSEETGREKVMAVFEKTQKALPEPWREETLAVFPYLPEPAGGEASFQVQQLAGLEAERIILTNGTVLQLKKTDFQPNEILLAIHFGAGRLNEPKRGLAEMAEEVVAESGFGGITREALKETLAGRNVALRFQVGEESFQLRGKALSREAALLFQLARHQLADPAFRADAFTLGRERLLQLHAEAERSVEGGRQLYVEPFLAGGNSRYGLPGYNALEHATLSDIATWLRPLMRESNLEISVVGDFDREEIIALTNRYFGGETRLAKVNPRGQAITFPAGQTLEKKITSPEAKALVVVAWPTADFWDIARTRRLNLLSAVLDDRLRLEIREKLGATYSPVVFNRSSRVDPGYGVLSCSLVVERGRAAEMAEQVRRTGEKLASNGLEGDELERALLPTLTSIKDMLRTNRYWLESVLALASRHPQQLEWPLTISADFAAITEGDVAKLARKYLREGSAASVVLLPAQ